MPQKKITLSLILPCYNETEHFNKSADTILQTLKRSGYSFEIIFVEDKSVDDTKKHIKHFITNHPKESLRAIYHSHNMGRGKSVVDGILQAKGSIVGFMDIDMEVSPIHIFPVIEAIEEGYDVAYGVRQFTLSFRSIRRWFASRLYQVLVKVLLYSELVDTESGFKFFRRDVALPIIKLTHHKGWFWDTEIMVLSFTHGLQMKGVPVLFTKRDDKTSTVKLWKDSKEYFMNLIHFRNQLKNDSKKNTTIDQYWKKKSSTWAGLYSNISPTTFFLKARYRKILPFLQDVKGKKVLDVGCGNGVFMKEVIKRGGTVVGIDYSEDMLKEAAKELENYDKHSYKLLVANATKLTFPNASFHLVLASGLTDYLSKEDDMRFLKETTRVLKAHGRAIITFPREDSPLQMLRSGSGLWLRKMFLSLPPIMSSFTKEEVVNYFKKLKFSVQSIDTVFSTMWVAVAEKD